MMTVGEFFVHTCMPSMDKIMGANFALRNTHPPWMGVIIRVPECILRKNHCKNACRPDGS